MRKYQRPIEIIKENIREEVQTAIQKDDYIKPEDAKLINQFLNKIRSDLEKINNKLKKTTHIILIPVYNDWRSLNRLISEIDAKIKELNVFRNEILIINDCSTKKIDIKEKNLNI